MDYKEEAIAQASEIDNKIIKVLCEGKSFRVEAGAGSGKTYSLMKVIEWLQDNKKLEYEKQGKKIACLTFTNAAVDVILARLKENSFIIPSTIHSFAWLAINQFQEKIINIMDSEKLIPEECNIEEIKSVQYTLGVKFFNDEEKTLYLGHSDILKLFSVFLDNIKFRKILANNYPIILIDEYQDSNGEIINKFINYFIDPEIGIQFGFFGDSWQTIYQMNHACGLIEHRNIEVINKNVNFRSSQVIVNALNKIRPDLPQISALPNNDGKVCVITSDNFKEDRRKEAQFRDDLPIEKLEEYVETIKDKYNCESEKRESLKILMLTHRMLASQQGYSSLLEILNDGLKNADDEFFCFVKDYIIPLIKAIFDNDIIGICEVLKISNYPIQRKSDKSKWSSLKHELIDIENKSIFEVISIFVEKSVLSLPEKVQSLYKKMQSSSEEPYRNGTLNQLKNIKYSEFESACEFVSPNSQYSTDHSVKGEEYDSVLFVIGRGWNLYQFDKSLTSVPKNSSEQASFERNRNLFYVCCSRAKRNLILFITIPLSPAFKKYLEEIVGKQNIISYEDYIK